MSENGVYAPSCGNFNRENEHSMDLGVSYFQANPYVYNSIGVFIDALKVCSRCFLVGGSGFNWYCIVSPLL